MQVPDSNPYSVCRCSQGSRILAIPSPFGYQAIAILPPRSAAKVPVIAVFNFRSSIRLKGFAGFYWLSLTGLFSFHLQH
jgi:hypothetical protein